MIEKPVQTFILLMFVANAQTPDMYPPPVPEPVELNIFNVILYILTPVILIVVFIYYRRWLKKKGKR